MYERNGIEQDEKTKLYHVKLNGKRNPIPYKTSTDASAALTEARIKARRKKK